MDVYIQYPDHITRVEDGACIPVDENNSDYQAFLAWVAEGNIASTPPPPSYADYQSAFMAQFSAWIEDVAHENAYDSSITCMLRINSNVPQFKADAQSFMDWTDALFVWMAGWAAGFDGQVPATIPSWDEVKAQAPQPGTYGWVVHPLGAISDAPAT